MVAQTEVSTSLIPKSSTGNDPELFPSILRFHYVATLRMNVLTTIRQYVFVLKQSYLPNDVWESLSDCCFSGFSRGFGDLRFQIINGAGLFFGFRREYQ
jgi:hypothetical protein